MKIRGLRWWIIGLVTLGTIINYLARSSLSIALPTLTDVLGMDEKNYSWVVASFQLAYTIAQPVCGYIIDTIGLKLGFTLCALAWSFSNIGHMFASSWHGLAVCRGIMGLSEASAIPAGMKATAEWFPASERGIAGGIFNMGTSVGAMLAPPLVVWAILSINWQASFVITGAIGIAFSVMWYFLYDSPAKQPWITDSEKKFIFDGQEQYLQGDDSKKVPVKEIISQRNFWALAATRFLADPAWGVINFWIPIFLYKTLHMTLKEIALYAWLPFLAADIGCVAGGFIAGYFIKKGYNVLNARRLAFTCGAILMTPIGLVSIVNSPTEVVALISLAGFAHQLLSTVAVTMGSDIFKRNQVATAVGLCGTAAWSGQLIFSAVLGSLVAVIGFEPFFVVLAFLDMVGAVILWLFIREKNVIAGDSRTKEDVLIISKLGN